MQQIRQLSVSRQSPRPQQGLAAAYYRGGTSRAIMFQRKDLPTNKESWPPLFRAAMGSPDPNGRQLDGMGGGVSSLSKVCIVGPSDRSDADVDYTFAAIGVKDTVVDMTSNCGNMTSAIGPYAVDCGLVKLGDGADRTTVRIHNTNTGKIIHSTFPLASDGRLPADGSFAIDGVAGEAAQIQLDFLNPSGSKTGKFLPTGRPIDVLAGHSATCVDVGNPCVFVRAEDLGVQGGILPDDIESQPDLLARLEMIRREAAVAMGISETVDAAPVSIPKVAMVAASHQHGITSGETLTEADMDLVVRSMSVGQPHRAVPVTVAMALAAAATLEGSAVKPCVKQKPTHLDGITIAHPSGKLLVFAKYDNAGTVESASVFRTARKIMDGNIFV